MFLIWKQLPPNEHLADQLRSAYDCYLSILRNVDIRVQGALGNMKEGSNPIICPPCFYKLDDDPVLDPAFLAAMDGNNSLKLVDSTLRAGDVRMDNRTLMSDRWIEPDEVNIFSDEVNRSKKKACDYQYLTLSILMFYTRRHPTINSKAPMMIPCL